MFFSHRIKFLEFIHGIRDRETPIYIAVLVTGGGDFVPPVRALMKQGVRVMAPYFEYKEGEHRGFINERLLNVCNYSIHMNDMAKDKDFKALFKGLFRKSDEQPAKPNGSGKNRGNYSTSKPAEGR